MSHTRTSPWITQLRADRPHFTLQKDIACNTAIIGAGIAGVTTAYQVLRHTSHSVVLVDAGRIAHGATGHNAGQVVSEFERPLLELAEQYGPTLAADAQRSIDAAWMILEELLTHTNIQTPLHTCTGYIGLCTIEQICQYAAEYEFKKTHHLETEPILVWTDARIVQQLPAHVRDIVTLVPRSKLLQCLQTNDTRFIAASVRARACANSALLCEELVGYLCTAYADRFTVAEQCPVHTIYLRQADGTIHTTTHTITAQSIVLCTNGFETLTVHNTAGTPIDAHFHHMVEGYIGYMTGYTTKTSSAPTAIAYLQPNMEHNDPYTYMTRRPYDYNQHSTLVCMGGPERPLPDRAEYDARTPFPAAIEEELDRTLETMYTTDSPLQKTFAWQGLMGYTNDRLRKIGYEPRNRVLLYNLGCNGIGILPSIYGGKRIAQLLDGKTFASSLFDPQ